jgi:hypothetical protein
MRTALGGLEMVRLILAALVAALLFVSGSATLPTPGSAGINGGRYCDPGANRCDSDDVGDSDEDDDGPSDPTANGGGQNGGGDDSDDDSDPGGEPF